jgi:hypothetical protein
MKTKMKKILAVSLLASMVLGFTANALAVPPMSDALRCMSGNTAACERIMLE